MKTPALLMLLLATSPPWACAVEEAAAPAAENPPAAGIPRAAALPVFALIPAGEFTMGDPLDVDLSLDWEKDAPPHQVTVGAFYMGKKEVTKAEWDSVSGLLRLPGLGRRIYQGAQ